MGRRGSPAGFCSSATVGAAPSGCGVRYSVLACAMCCDRSLLGVRMARTPCAAGRWLVFVFEVLLPIYFIRAAMLAYTVPQPALSAGIYKSSRPKVTIGFIAGACIALIGLCFTASAQPSASTSSSAQNRVIATAAAPTLQPTQSKTEPTPTPQPTPTPRPTQAPTPIPPTQPPVAQTQPTQPPAPPVHTGVNGNPWGYDFSPGSLIYQPSSNFCDYFACIKSFWQNTNGYVDECNDGMYSHSGGVSGACSKHGGEMRPLYSH